MKKKLRILFICKDRNSSYGVSFGLINSCQFICNELKRYDIECKVIQVQDNNCIDREVHSYKPTHVFIEALWVIPEKFHVLLPLYPKVEWYVRVHSKIPFIAHEGMAIDWFKGYQKIMKHHKNFHISANNMDIVESLYRAFNIRVCYHPNIYHPPDYYLGPKTHKQDTKYVDIGCFGAIRPMKNQLYQALAAIAFGNEIHKSIRFHINADRVEQKGDTVLKNIKHAFEGTPHTLVCHKWLNHKDFIKLVRTMELGMQVSFSETFNIVAADFVWNGIPVVCSPEMEWMSFLYKANTNSLNSIVTKLYIAYYGRKINLQYINKLCLDQYNYKATMTWLEPLI